MGVVSANLPMMRPICLCLWQKLVGIRTFFSRSSTTHTNDVTPDHQVSRARGLVRTLYRESQELTVFSVTSKAERRRDSEAIRSPLMQPVHGIAIRTRLEHEFEDLKDGDLKKPERVAVEQKSDKVGKVVGGEDGHLASYEGVGRMPDNMV